VSEISHNNLNKNCAVMIIFVQSLHSSLKDGFIFPPFMFNPAVFPHEYVKCWRSWTLLQIVDFCSAI